MVVEIEWNLGYNPLSVKAKLLFRDMIILIVMNIRKRLDVGVVVSDRRVTNGDILYFIIKLNWF